MNVTDEVAKVATTTVEALRQTPLVLSLVIFNLLFMAAMVYVSVKAGARTDAEMGRMHELVAKVIAQCGPKQP
jgi:ABC-type amino acid transport system permease subunit